MVNKMSNIIKYSEDGKVLGCGKVLVHWWCGALHADGHRVLCVSCNNLSNALVLEGEE